jgi:glycine cleavage system H protein
MSTVNNCNIPDDLLYQVDKHVWVRPEPDGSVLIGMTDVAQKLAGKIIVVTPKRVGRSVTRGQSAGTVESSKWVGPVPSPLSGQIVAVNDRPQTDPAVLNADPYGNWIVRLQPSAWEEERGGLVTGPEGVEAYRRLLVTEGIDCGS